MLDDAVAQAKQGKIAEALAGYADAQQRSPSYVIDASYWNNLCRAGALAGQVQAVQESCGRAVALEPDNGGYRNSRRISRALVGDSWPYRAWAGNQVAEGFLMPRHYCRLPTAYTDDCSGRA